MHPIIPVVELFVRLGVPALAKPASGFMAVVLIVEDEDQVRVLAEGILQDGGHETLSASTAEQALAHC